MISQEEWGEKDVVMVMMMIMMMLNNKI